MESSRRAVESYWRWRLIDSATSDEDKVTPVYKLDEICELLRSSHPSIVKELSEFILKRLDHKSPIVKHKALRLIKYAIGKSSAEFKREMQRHSVAIRQLLQYKGQLDPLKADALNKAVRDIAQETISAIFSSEDDNSKSLPASSTDLNRRIQGFGNTSFQAPSQDKKSFLSEVVDLGSATIKQGLSVITQAHSSLIKNETGTGNCNSPNLRSSFTVDMEHGDRYEPVNETTQCTYGISKNQAGTGGSWNQDSGVAKVEVLNGDTGAGYEESKALTREDRLLETVVTSGGVRLQPTRDAIQVFLAEAAKLDAVALCHAIERKLQSPMWQVRMKAVCVLESILRKKDDDHFSHMASYFSKNNDVVLRCSESPHASLREKANKVLGLLGGGQPNSCAVSGKAVKTESAAVAELPDLIDTGDLNDYHGMGNTAKSTNDQNMANDDDPFADVSFHSNESKEHADDIFSGMTVGDNKLDHHMSHGPVNKSNSRHVNNREFVGDLLAGLSFDENTSNTKQKATSPAMQSESLFSGSNSHSSHPVPDTGLSGMPGSQAVGSNVNPMFPSGHLPYTMRPGIILNQPYSSEPLNYGVMGNLLAQQQFLATMNNFQHLNNANKQDGSTAQIAGPNGRTPLPDIFQSNFSTQSPSSMIKSSKKEETKAFDFISDHLSASYDSRRVI
ncbi:hypothetical protein RJT34_28210 [Clitoria ternatea]|uniref:VHS domain-containing protein n=1 Tax=Clitoria ternatea TaxID=43366 RepID=A0AAN9F8G9_CLITE